MNTKLLIAGAISLALLPLLLLVGCAGFDHKFLEPQLVVDSAGQTNVAFTPSPAVTGPVAAVRTVTPVLPQPAGALVDGVLALALAGLGWYAKVKTRQAQEHKTAADLATDLLQATVAGVEIAGDKTTKQRIAAAAAGAGLSKELNAKVQEVSSSIPAP